MSREEFRALVANYLTQIRANRAVPRALSEASLYAPLDGLLNGFLLLTGRERVHAIQQFRTEFGIPDFVVDAGGPIGYVEAKKPTAKLDDLNPRDQRQLESFLNLPNVLYTNYLDFRLFDGGQEVASVSLGGADVLDYRRPASASPGAIDALYDLVDRFASHRIHPPRSISELADALARVTRVLLDATLAALKSAPGGAVASLREQWRLRLFHEASDQDFADAYAQTVTYGLLTARLDMDGDLGVAQALEALHARHPFLEAALHLLTDSHALDEVGWAVDLVIETLDGVGPDLFAGGRNQEDPLLYFYEDFLDRYDREMRKRRGVYFTPASVVSFQVRAIADLCAGLGRKRLLADDVVALDPAAGTGTYLLGLLDESAAQVRELEGDAAVAAGTVKAAAHLNGFELLVGPYTVAHQRLAARLAALNAPEAPVRVFLVDTLAAPDAPGSGQLMLPFERELSEERQRADEVKREAQVMVVVGNPPYERAKARPAGDWLQQEMSLFSRPVSAAARVNLKNLSDAYVYFFRWALWKLFESRPPAGPRIHSFISNRSYLGGDWAEGLRLVMRQRFDEIWIVDLEGESRGPLATENVFDIRVGVAIIVALRHDAGEEKSAEARVRYARLTGSREDKERGLKATLEDLEWLEVERERGAPFLPLETPAWRRWAAIDEIMPFRQSGVQTKRDALVVGVTPQRLLSQMVAFAEADPSERRHLFHETTARSCPSEFRIDSSKIRPYGYRPLDTRWLYDDKTFIDRPRPKLRKYWHEGQLAFATLPKGHGPGPVLVLQRELPDLHAFRGSFGGHIFPFWMDPEHREPNLAPGLLRFLRSHLDPNISPDEIFAYVLGLLSAPGYQRRFATDLAQGFPRVPFPVEAERFHAIRDLGRELLEVHEMRPGGRKARFIGRAGPVVERPEWSDKRLRVSSEGFVEPVSEPAWDYAVSGYRVIEGWLTAGKNSRVGLDLSQEWDSVDQLLKVVDSVEQTVRLGPRLDAALGRVLDGETLGRPALLPLDLRAAAEEFARSQGDLDTATDEANTWEEVSNEALFRAES